MTVKVIAISSGFYNGSIVMAGESFEFPKGRKLGRWMQLASSAKPLPEKEKKVPKEPSTFSELAKAAGKEQGNALI